MALSKLPLRAFGAAAILAAIGGAAPQQQAPADEFAQSIRPVLTQNCASCHTARSRINFLKAENAKGIEANRGLWRSVAAQLRNRTMPPVESKLTEEERLRVVVWVEDYLRKTACSAGEFAGAPALRRLNRREYRNTVRDLLGTMSPPAFSCCGLPALRVVGMTTGPETVESPLWMCRPVAVGGCREIYVQQEVDTATDDLAGTVADDVRKDVGDSGCIGAGGRNLIGRQHHGAEIKGVRGLREQGRREQEQASGDFAHGRNSIQ